MQNKKTVRHPGPLQELPIERFLPPNPNLQVNGLFKATPSKRPLSPIHFSPTKRRILYEECIPSPEKTLKTPSSCRSQGRFEQLLSGPNSPAKKLDFGRAKETSNSSRAVASFATAQNSSIIRSTRPTTPRSSSIPNKLASSPEFKTKPSSSYQSSSPFNSDDGELDDNSSSHSSRPYPALTMVPRDMPPLPDRQSIHYPGFDVHMDSHIFLPHVRHLSSGPDHETDQETDKQKENVPPRKRSRKALLESGISSDIEKEEEFFGNMGSPVHTPRKKVTTVAREGTPTPRRSTVRMDAMTSPHSTPAASQVERRERRRRMLVDEVDGRISDDDALL